MGEYLGKAILEQMKPAAADTLKPTYHGSPIIDESNIGDEEAPEEVVAGPEKSVTSTAAAVVTELILKIPALTWLYWAEKMTVTTFGETFADMWSQTLGLGYSATSATLMSISSSSWLFSCT
jgi:hypothetical protein